LSHAARLQAVIHSEFGAATANGDETALSLDYLVGRGEQRLRYAQCERICGLEVDEQIEFDRRLHGKLGRLRTLENAIDIAGGAAEEVDRVDP